MQRVITEDNLIELIEDRIYYVQNISKSKSNYEVEIIVQELKAIIESIEYKIITVDYIIIKKLNKILKMMLTK